MYVAGNTSSITCKIRYDADGVLAKPENMGVEMLPRTPNAIVNEDIEVRFSNKSFYDTVPFKLVSQQANSAGAVSNVFLLHNFTVPVHDSFTVKIKTRPTFPLHLKDRVVMQLISNRKKVATKGKWAGDWMEAKFWDLGKVQLMVDSTPPTLTPIGFRNNSNLAKAKSITF